MASHFTQKDIDEIVRLHEVEGLTHKDIAIKLGRMDRKGNPNARAVMEQYAKYKRMQSLNQKIDAVINSNDVASIPFNEVVPMTSESVPPLLPMNVPLEASNKVERFAQTSEVMTVPKSQQPYVFNPDNLKINEDSVNLSEMSRNQRYEYLRKNLLASARGQHTFNKILSKDETDLFCEEYFRILKEQDSLTNAEEQQLFTAILNYVLYHRALELDHAARLKYESGQAGAMYDTRWQKEYNDRYIQYQRGIEALKLSREQRLQDLARSGNTFLDFAELISKKENQEALAEEIIKIESASVDELKRLQENGWLIFGTSPNNNPEVNYFDEKKD